MDIDSSDKFYKNLTNVTILLDSTGKVLLSQRKVTEGTKFQGGAWVFPGGGLDIGETIVEGAKRELLEECGVDIELKNFVPMSFYEGNIKNDKRCDKTGKIKGFTCSIAWIAFSDKQFNKITVKIQPEEVQDYEWVDLKVMVNIAKHV